jgi:hypothetical protein
MRMLMIVLHVSVCMQCRVLYVSKRATLADWKLEKLTVRCGAGNSHLICDCIQSEEIVLSMNVFSTPK